MIREVAAGKLRLMRQDDVGDRVASLTERQKEFLRLTYAHKTSKEIALKVGRSRHLVDQQISFACQKLGTRNRKEAALILAEWDRRNGYEQFLYEPITIGESAPETTAFPQLEPGTIEDPAQAGAVDTAQRQVGFVEDLLPPRRARFPVPRHAEDVNDFTIAQKLCWILAIASISIIVVSVILDSMYSISTFLSR